MKTTCITLIFSIMLLGCAHTSPTVVGNNKPVILSEYVYEPCKSLNTLPIEASFEVLLESYINNIAIYTDCKNKQNNSIKIIRELTNTVKETK